MNRRLAVSLAVVLCLASASKADEPAPPAVATVLDPDVMLGQHPQAVVSPDGGWVAYVSKGFICVCNVAHPEPRRLFEVPDSETHFLAQPEQAYANGDLWAVLRGLSRDEQTAIHAKITRRVAGLRWTYDSRGVAWNVFFQKLQPKTYYSDFWYSSIYGRVKHLAHMSGDDNYRGISGNFHLTRDRRLLVSVDFDRPLIWNVAMNKPLATCFHCLTPSPSSGRWIGIEKDSRQLVVTNADFHVVRRLDEYLPARTFGFDLQWSPDEKCILWRNQVGFDYFSNWEGFWMNLDTGQKRPLSGRFMSEQFGFTGRGGEFFRCSSTGMKTRVYDKVVGAHLTLVPPDGGEPHDVWRLTVGENVPGALTILPFNPPLRVSSDGRLFAIGLPRPAGQPSGVIWHLMDRDGKAWQFPGPHNGKFQSPFEPVGFAAGDTLIVCHNGRQMFSLPVAAIIEP